MTRVGDAPNASEIYSKTGEPPKNEDEFVAYAKEEYDIDAKEAKDIYVKANTDDDKAVLSHKEFTAAHKDLKAQRASESYQQGSASAAKSDSPDFEDRTDIIRAARPAGGAYEIKIGDNA